MSTKKRSKSTNWLSVAKCVTVPFHKWNEYPRLTGGISYVVFVSMATTQQSTTCEPIFKTEIRRTTNEEVLHGR